MLVFIRRVLFCFTLFTTIFSAYCLSADVRPLYLRADTSAFSSIHHSFSPFNIRSHDASPVTMIVQFDSANAVAQACAATNSTVRICGYIPENALLVRGNTHAVNRFATHNNSVWHDIYTPNMRVSPCIAKTVVRTSANQHADPLYNSTNLSVFVCLFPGVNSNDVSATITHVEGTIDCSFHAGERIILKTVVPAHAIPEIAAVDGVEWIEEYVEPELRNDISRGAHGMQLEQRADFLGLDGNGEIIGHADSGIDIGKIDGLHPDFTNRIKIAVGVGRIDDWSDPLGHGTHTAGSIVGTGAASDGQFRGMAPGAQLIHQSILSADGSIGNATYDMDALFAHAYENGARIHANSWGTQVNGAYTLQARVADEFAWHHPEMLIVFSAGNGGNDGNANGQIDSYSLDSPGTAKNVLTVGAAESHRLPGSGGLTSLTWEWFWPWAFPAPPLSGDFISWPADNFLQGIAAFSSRGPAADGRIKPDIVAPGTSIISCRSHHEDAGTMWAKYDDDYCYSGGSSMSSPLAAGAAAIVRQWCREYVGIDTPSAALIKALLINGARSLAPGQYRTGADQEIPSGHRGSYAEGWGMLDIARTLPTDTSTVWCISGVSTGQTTAVYHIPVDAGTTLRATLAYTDYPASITAARTLVNDIDMSVKLPGNSSLLYSQGKTSPDRYNNIECLDIPVNAGGTAVVSIAGYSLPMGPQPYALVIVCEQRATTCIVEHITQKPLYPAENTDVTISAYLSCRTDNGVEAQIHYYIDEGPVNVVTADSTFENADRAIVSAIIPGMADDTEIIYCIVCRVDDTIFASDYYMYTVGQPVLYVTLNKKDAEENSNTFTTISSAIDAAPEGAKISVAPGKYKEFLCVLNKPIELYAEQGPEKTIIDMKKISPCVTISHPDAIVDGFTFSHGYAANWSGSFGGGITIYRYGTIHNCIIEKCKTVGRGGGIACIYGGVVSNCVIRKNEGQLGGGGIYLYYGGTVIDSIVTQNKTHDEAGHGGGIYCIKSGVVKNTIISRNKSRFNGGGVWVYAGGIFDNCTINRNHSKYKGGGIYVENGGIFTACSLTKNRTKYEGGGVYSHCDNYYTPPTFTQCTFRENKAREGGGVYAYKITISDSYFHKNTAKKLGGGIHAIDGNFTDCTLTENRAKSGGGASVLLSANIDNCTFLTNRAKNGGGVWVGFNGTIENCNMQMNRAKNGGGIYSSDGGNVSRNNVVNNTARDGGGIYLHALENENVSYSFGNHVKNNFARRNGGGIMCKGKGIVRNTIIDFNIARRNSGGIFIDKKTPADIHNSVITHNSSHRGIGGISMSETSAVVNSIIYWNTGKDADNIPDDPITRTAVSYSCVPNTYGLNNCISELPFARGNSYIPAGKSVCIDAGKNFSWMNDDTDFNGIMRVVDKTVDIGCYEYAQFDTDTSPLVTITHPLDGAVFDYSNRRVTVYGTYEDDHGVASLKVNGRKTIRYSSNKWRWISKLHPGKQKIHCKAIDSAGQEATAEISCTILPEPIDPVITGHVAYVSHLGTHSWPYTNWYTASTNLEIACLAAQDNTVINVHSGIYSSANIEIENAVTIRGAFGPDATFCTGNNATRCFFLNHPNARIENLTICNGNATYGAGVYSKYKGGLQNCVISHNTAKTDGGGVYFFEGGCISNCVIVNNIAKRFGGGGVFRGNAVITSSEIRGNYSGDTGGGALGDDYTQFSDCTISDNSASNTAGGLSLLYATKVERCTIADNSALFAGGIYALSGPEILNSYILRNNAKHVGGIYGTYARIRGCIIAKNSSKKTAGVSVAFNAVIENCTIVDNAADRGVGGALLDENSTIANSILNNNTSRTGPNHIKTRKGSSYAYIAFPKKHTGDGCIKDHDPFINAHNGNYRLIKTSVCIDAADERVWMYAHTDADGNSRISDSAPDIGAYEYLPQTHALPSGYIAECLQYTANTVESETIPEPFTGITGILLLISFLSTRHMSFSSHKHVKRVNSPPIPRPNDRAPL